MGKSFPAVFISAALVFVTASCSGDRAISRDRIPRPLAGEQLLAFDFADSRYSELGIRRITEFDVDSNGNIFLADGKHVFKFDDKGLFVTFLGRVGQGPGEYGFVEGLRLTEYDQVSFFDPQSQKFLLFSNTGTFVREEKLTGIYTVKGIFIESGLYLILQRKERPREGKREFFYCLVDNNGRILREFSPRYFIDMIGQSLKINLMEYGIFIQIIGREIFVADNMSDRIQIEVYDLLGNPKRRLLRKTPPVRITEEDQYEMLGRWEKTPVWEQVKFKHYFPRFYPPFKTFIADKDFGLIVELYDRPKNPDENRAVWFRLDGAYAGEVVLARSRLRVMKNGILYGIREDENGNSRMEVNRLAARK